MPALNTKQMSCGFSVNVTCQLAAATLRMRHSLNEKLRDWNSGSIEPPSLHENRYRYCSRSSRAHFRRLRFEHLLALYSDATSAARLVGDFTKALSWKVITFTLSAYCKWLAVCCSYRALRPAGFDAARPSHCEHRARPHFPRPQRTANGSRHLPPLDLSCLAISRRVCRIGATVTADEHINSHHGRSKQTSGRCRSRQRQRISAGGCQRETQLTRRRAGERRRK